MKPIIFSTAMVQAILDGRKTQTRRVVKGSQHYSNFVKLEENPVMGKADKDSVMQPVEVVGLWATFESEYDPLFPMIKCRYQPSDILYVRETWRAVDYQHIDGEWSASIQFKDMTFGERVRWKDGADTIYERFGWRPSIHMPKEAARLFLRVTGVRVERLQDISEEDAIKEGCEPVACADCDGWGCESCRGSGCAEPARLEFNYLWDSLNAKRGYGRESNPWVWVYEFERVARPEG